MQTTNNTWNSTLPAAATLMVNSEQSTLNSLSLFLRDRMRWSCFVWKTKSLHQQQGKGRAELSNCGKGSFISSCEFSHVNSTLGFLEYCPQGSFTILIQQITGEKGPQTHDGLAITQCVPDFWAFELQHTAIFLLANVLHVFALDIRSSEQVAVKKATPPYQKLTKKDSLLLCNVSNVRTGSRM